MTDKPKPLSFRELQLRRFRISDEGNRLPEPFAHLAFDTEHPETRGYVQEMQLAGRIQEVLNRYENATDPKQKYRATSELCRLVDRISGGNAMVYLAQGDDKVYVASCERYEGYRIPQLAVFQSKSFEEAPQLDLFVDESHSVLHPITLEEEAKFEALYLQSAWAYLLGRRDKELVRKYRDAVFDRIAQDLRETAQGFDADTIRDLCSPGRLVGVKKEEK